MIPCEPSTGFDEWASRWEMVRVFWPWKEAMDNVKRLIGWQAPNFFCFSPKL